MTATDFIRRNLVLYFNPTRTPISVSIDKITALNMMDQCDRKCEDSGKTIEYSLIDDEEFESKAPEADLTTCCESTPDSNQKHAAILQSLD